jgi:hypothetical protein
MTKVAIMQPTYLPWAGYFGLMMASDIFIFLDNVQFQKRGWQQRNQIKTLKGNLFLTVPVKTKNRYNQFVNEVEVDNSTDFKKNHFKSIEFNYNKTDFFKQYELELKEIYNKKYDKLVTLNYDLIYWIKEKLNIRTKLIKSSDFEKQGNKDELITNLVEKVNSKNYLFTEGSKDYILDSKIFQYKKIKLTKFNFNIEVYKQQYENFLPYMSIIDLLFNLGEKSEAYLKKNINLEDV